MRNTVVKLLDNRLVYLLISVIAAFILWLWVVNEVNPSDTRTFTFAVQYEGEGVLEAYNLRLASDRPEQIRMRVTASVMDMNRIEQNPQIIVDVSGIREPGEHDVGFRLASFDIMPGNISYTPLGGEPSHTHNTIIVRTNRMTGRVMPLSTTGITSDIVQTGDAAYSFVRESQSVYPESIQIDGPEEIIDQIAAIEVVADFPEPLSETTTKTGTLRVYNHAGDLIPEEYLQDVLFSPETVNVTVVVLMVRQVPLVPVFEFGAGAGEDNVDVGLSQDTVQLMGDADVLRNLDHLELAPIHLDQVELVDVIRRDIPIPALTEILDGPEYVEVQIQIRDVVELEMSIPSSRIFFTGVPDEVEPEAALDTITLVIRGPEEIVAELDESEISVFVNLSDYIGQIGQVIVEEATVLVDDWPPEVVGARNGLRIIVNLRRVSG